MDFQELKIEYWPIEKLIPYARNPRKNDSQVDKMAGAIREFGFRIPIVAKSDGAVVDGHLRLKAAQKLGLETVPVVLADELTDAQIKAFRLLANRSANWAEWDEELLKLELEDLKMLDFDLELTGFDVEELEGLVIDTAPLDEMPVLPENEKNGFQSITFILTNEQANEVKAAIERAKELGDFVDTGNENSNGNALARICEMFRP